MLPPRTPNHSHGVDRRRFLAVVGALAGTAAAAQVPLADASAAPRPDIGFPFTLGVASGDPGPDGVVLWTRLAPDPLVPGGGAPGRDLAVEWAVYSDERLRTKVASGLALAPARLAHSVHVELRGLRPWREYWFRFRYRGHVSDVGRTRTAPAAGHPLRTATLATVSCQDYSSGFYTAYRHLVDDDPHLVLHLGDYVYEGAVGATAGARGTPVPEPARPAPRTLEQWRIRYALYKSDADLRAAHAAVPFAVTWDDHEVQNDYAGTRSQYEGDISALRAAAYQAYYEHQPLRVASIPRPDGGLTLHRGLDLGGLVRLSMLDGRQHRDVPPGGWGEAPASAAAYAPSVTMLGRRQESWLTARLRAGRAHWAVLGNNVMMARLEHEATPGARLWHDAWDGFPAARNRITEVLATARVRNPVVLTGDWHSTFVNDIRQDFDDPGSPVVATEFVGTSVTTNGDREVYGPYYGPMIRYNPHIRYFDGDRRGYQLHTVTRAEWRTDLRTVEFVGRRGGGVSTSASFVVESGRPGAQRL
ncbi:alkaline phosphatase D family protein [Phycicoccus sp. CSK15P-2]|uniref:alkaline phosphatase D family protein n=1 Tax=Phycicoccus sp. CSK15P-2 TaxID=2807627 RepID=UPI0027DD9D1D|nr:alkaline phosphatase D family protein [Phycicoccus sp. CSK15P-2]